MATAVRSERLRLPLPTLALRATGAGLAGAGCAAILGAVAWMVLAAAERPSPLSPPTIRTPAAWLLGPLHGLMPGLDGATKAINSDELIVVIVAAVGWLVVWIAAPAVKAGALFAASAIAQVLLVLGPPLPLTDVFNYELYGRMAALHGMNPYRDLPIAAGADPTYLLSNWHHLTSPYGPLFTALSELLVPFGLHGWLWAWKAVELASGIGTLALVSAIAGRLGVSRQRAIACFGLSPLVLIYEVGALHNDLPAMLCLVGAVWCLVRSRDGAAARVAAASQSPGDADLAGQEAAWPPAQATEPTSGSAPSPAPVWVDPLAGVLVVVAAGIKPSFAIVAGIVVLGAGNRPRAIAGAVVAGLFTLGVMEVLYGGAIPDVKTQGMLVTPLSIPNLVGLAVGHGGADAAMRGLGQDVMVAVAAIATLAVAWRRQWAVAATGIVMLVTLLTLPWVMAWYLIWALPFVAVARPRWLAPVAVLATAWLIVGSVPQLSQLMHSVGYYPTRLPTGLANHREFVTLLK